MTGVEMIAAERDRQVTVEGWTAEHDDAHASGEMSLAAACYLITEPAEFIDFYWPWEFGAFKPSPDDRLCELAKAGALVAAEIDRLHRRCDA